MADINVYQLFAEPLTKGPLLFGRSSTYTFAVDSDPTKLFYDKDNGFFGIGTNLPTATLNVEGTVIFNDLGAAEADVRMEGDSQTHLFFLDTSTDRIGINQPTPTHQLDVVGDFACTTLYGQGQLQTADDNLFVGSSVVDTNFFIDRPGAGGQLIIGHNTPRKTGATGAYILTVYDNSTDRNWLFTCKSCGSTGGQEEVIINEGAEDVDLRAESLNYTNCFLVEASADRVVMGYMTSAGFVKNTAAGILSGGNTIDISADTNLAVTSPIVLTDDTLSLDQSAVDHDSLLNTHNLTTDIDHDALTNFAAGEHFLQTAITNVSTALATGLLKVTTSTGALSVIADNSANWNVAYTHVSNDGSDHSFLDQSVISGASPTFDGANFTGIPDGALDSAFLKNIVEDTSPQLGADLDLNDFQVQLKFEPGSNVTASGLIISVTVDTNAEGVGAPLFEAADGHFDTANASASTTSPAMVLALETGTGTKKVLVHGILRVDAWNWTKGPGTLSLIYVNTTVGTLTQTQPSATDQVVQPVGWALSDDCIYFCPSLIYFTHT